jgi:hypothetical protein
MDLASIAFTVFATLMTMGGIWRYVYVRERERIEDRREPRSEGTNR